MFGLRKLLPPRMMNLIDLEVMRAQQAKMSSLNMRYLESETPQDFLNIYGLGQSESAACPAAKVSTCRWNNETNGHVYLFTWSVGLHALNVIVRFSPSGGNIDLTRNSHNITFLISLRVA